MRELIPLKGNKFRVVKVVIADYKGIVRVLRRIYLSGMVLICGCEWCL